MSAFSRLSDRKKIEDLWWTKTRTRGRGRQKIQGGNLQQEVVRNGSLIKLSTPLPLMATVKNTTFQGGEMKRIYQDDGSSKGEQTGD